MTPRLVAGLFLAGATACTPPPPDPAPPPAPSAEEEVVVLKSGPGEDLGPATGAGTSMAPAVQKPGDHAGDGGPGDGVPIIEPGEVVPPFRVTTVDGRVLDSQDLVGKRPFVVVFFAIWCPVCEQKLPLVDAALEAVADDDLLVIGGAYDEDETWEKVAPYVKRHGLDDDLAVVRIMRHRRFGLSYDPFGRFPLVMVINRAGIIAELQMGLKPGHELALKEALRVVQDEMKTP